MLPFNEFSSYNCIEFTPEAIKRSIVHGKFRFTKGRALKNKNSRSI